MCLTPAMRETLQRARAELLTVIETLTDLSDLSACDDLVHCEDHLIGSSVGKPPDHIGAFEVPFEASPLVMAVHLRSWLTLLEDRINERQAAQN